MIFANKKDKAAWINSTISGANIDKKGDNAEIGGEDAYKGFLEKYNEMTAKQVEETEGSELLLNP